MHCTQLIIYIAGIIDHSFVFAYLAVWFHMIYINIYIYIDIGTENAGLCHSIP